MLNFQRFTGYIGSKTSQNSNFESKLVLQVLVALMGISLVVKPAMAHHATGYETPDNIINGLISGLAHPVIGLDHLAFVVASGLLAVGQVRGFLIPVAFAIATMLGTGVHLQGINLPIVEIIIALSVIIAGTLLACKKVSVNSQIFPTIALIILASFAGIFHGYAYGEAIIGAKMTALFSYLIGFTTIQLVIAGIAYLLGDKIFKRLASSSFTGLNFLGLLIGTIGCVFLT
jgi:urease accessory protein